MKKEKINIIIGFIIGLILIIVASLYTSITDNLYLAIGEFIGFKWLINIIIFLLLIISLLKYFYTNVSISESETISNEPSTEVVKQFKEAKEPKEPTKSEIEDSYKYIFENLSKDEKLLLKEYLDNDTKTRSFSMHNGVAMGLKSMNVLYISSSIGRGRGAIFPFNLQPWAWEMLKKYPKYLKI